MMESDSGESIAVRVSKLNQLFVGRAGQFLEHKALASREGLLDALVVLYEECSTDHLMKNDYIANFVKKCKNWQWKNMIGLSISCVTHGHNNSGHNSFDKMKCFKS